MAKPAKNVDSDGVDDAAEDLTGVKRKSRAGSSSTPAKKAAPKKTAAKSAATESADADGKADKAEAVAAGDDASEKKSRQVSLTLDMRQLLLAGAAVLAAAALIFCMLNWFSARQQVRAFNDIQATASKFVTSMVTVSNAEEAAKAKEVLGPMSTGKLRETLSQQRDEHTKQTKQLNVKATSEIQAAAVESIRGDNSSALVIAKIESSGSMAPTKTANRVVMRVDLTRERHGFWAARKWYVNKAELIGSTVLQDGGPKRQQTPLPPGMPGSGSSGN
ncbi:MAG: hypothetical protein QM728_08655 [Gordonia sp. (in: high G+C Gram-positive bacteria)]|uniref:hypothetical protein n=1 Tax=Gordonia sp. (in: high G+C Gram-positive bacteria) TaxID=84139 RepID=UPI0039E570A3